MSGGARGCRVYLAAAEADALVNLLGGWCRLFGHAPADAPGHEEMAALRSVEEKIFAASKPAAPSEGSKQ